MLAARGLESAVNPTIRRLTRLAALAACLHVAMPCAVARAPPPASRDTDTKDAAQAKAKLAAVRELFAAHAQRADLLGRAAEHAKALAAGERARAAAESREGAATAEA